MTVMRSSARHWVGWLIVLVLVVSIGVGVIHGYRVMRAKRLLELAQLRLDEGDYQAAAQFARRLLTHDAQHPDAIRIMQRISALAPETQQHLQWNLRLLEVEPDNRELLIPTAAGLLTMGDEAGVLRLLARYEAIRTLDGELLMLAALSHLGLGNGSKGAALLDAHLEKHPEDADLQLMRAKYGLMNDEPRFEQELRDWPMQDPRRAEALKSLFRSQIQRGQHQQAAVTADIILQENLPRALQLAALQWLMLRPEISPESWRAALLRHQRSSSTSSEIYELMRILQTAGQHQEVITWFGQLPIAERRTPLLMVAYAESLLDQGEETRLDELLTWEEWSEAEEIQRLIRTQRSLASSHEKKQRFRQLAVQLRESPKKLVKLVELTERWGWNEPLAVLLEEMTELFPENPAILSRLHRLHREQQDTLGLLNTARKAVRQDPANREAINNLATLSTLLDLNPRKAFRLAQSNYEHEPENPAFAVTYAFALHRQNRTQEGLAVLASLPKSSQSLENVRFYRAVLQRSTGQAEEADAILRSLDLDNLLPEERELIPQ